MTLCKSTNEFYYMNIHKSVCILYLHITQLLIVRFPNVRYCVCTCMNRLIKCEYKSKVSGRIIYILFDSIIKTIPYKIGLFISPNESIVRSSITSVSTIYRDGTH